MNVFFKFLSRSDLFDTSLCILRVHVVVYFRTVCVSSPDFELEFLPFIRSWKVLSEGKSQIYLYAAFFSRK